MAFCAQCGSDNPVASRFCDQCGAELIVIPLSTPAPTTAPAVGKTINVSGTPVAGPSTCPQCGTGVIPGEAFCDNCGAALLATPAAATGAPNLPFSGVPPQPSYPPPQPAQPAPTVPAPSSSAPARVTLAPASLRVHASGVVLALPATTQATIGRADPVSNFFPDIDVIDHGALEHGVGRRHAQLVVQHGQLAVEDLDSTNGTFVNGTKLAPDTPQVLHDGDELRLGGLVLRVHGG